MVWDQGGGALQSQQQGDLVLSVATWAGRAQGHQVVQAKGNQVIIEQGWVYHFSTDHPTCKRCGRPEISKGFPCYCINESHVQAAVVRAEFDQQRAALDSAEA